MFRIFEKSKMSKVFWHAGCFCKTSCIFYIGFGFCVFNSVWEHRLKIFFDPQIEKNDPPQIGFVPLTFYIFCFSGIYLRCVLMFPVNLFYILAFCAKRDVLSSWTYVIRGADLHIGLLLSADSIFMLNFSCPRNVSSSRTFI